MIPDARAAANTRAGRRVSAGCDTAAYRGIRFVVPGGLLRRADDFAVAKEIDRALSKLGVVSF